MTLSPAVGPSAIATATPRFNSITGDGGWMVHRSPSRRERWRRCDASGHVKHWEELRVDRDAEVVLAKIQREWAACHSGERSCFFRTLDAEPE